MTLLVTGGAGFIGSHFVREWLQRSQEPVINVDALQYAGDLARLTDCQRNPRHHFVHADIRDSQAMRTLLATHQPRAVVHFAAQTHVDRSIADPSTFLHNNVEGTHTLLEACRQYWHTLPAQARAHWRFLHVSTDEVYGSLAAHAAPADENSPYLPSSPYAASKAASDHFVTAWHRTYGLPVLLSHCANNYGPQQYPEKLIPHMITCALNGAVLPIYGDGQQQRDWLHVSDHCEALRRILADGSPGERFNIGSGQEQTNLALVLAICAHLDQVLPRTDGRAYAEQIRHVADRPGHDTRYALNTEKIRRTLNWRPTTLLARGLPATIDWYVAQHRAAASRPPT